MNLFKYNFIYNLQLNKYYVNISYINYININLFNRYYIITFKDL